MVAPKLWHNMNSKRLLQTLTRMQINLPFSVSLFYRCDGSAWVVAALCDLLRHYWQLLGGHVWLTLCS
jgi:hypothetical protein